MKLRNGYIDLLKLFMCYLVIMLHFSYHPITRIAVPFFFMISGYFAFDKNNDVNYKIEKTKKQIVRSLKYLIIGLSFYFVYDLIMLFIDHKSLMDYIRGLTYNNLIIDNLILNKDVTSGYHLWFLFALVTVNIIHYFLVKFDKTSFYKYICIPLLSINLIISVYLSLSVVGRVYQIEYTRNAILFGLPLFGIGYLIADINFDKLKSINLVVLFLAIIFMILQGFENKLYLNLFKIEAEFFICSIVGSMLFIIYCKNLQYKGQWLYKIVDGKISFYIYVIHVMIGGLISRFFGIKNLKLTFVTIVISTLVYFIGRFSWTLFKSIKNKILKNN